jgi:hypothetical protein
LAETLAGFFATGFSPPDVGPLAGGSSPRPMLDSAAKTVSATSQSHLMLRAMGRRRVRQIFLTISH